MAYIPPSEAIEKLAGTPTSYHYQGIVTDVYEETVNVRLAGSRTISRNLKVGSDVDIKKIKKNMQVRLLKQGANYYVASYFLECSSDLIYEPKGCEDPPPPNMKVEAGSGGTLVTWTESSGATEYIVYVSNVSGDRVEVGRTTELGLEVARDLPDGYKVFSVVAKNGDCYSDNQQANSETYPGPGSQVPPPPSLDEEPDPVDTETPVEEGKGEDKGVSVCIKEESYSLNAPPFFNDYNLIEAEQYQNRTRNTIPVEGLPGEVQRWRVEAMIGDEVTDLGIKTIDDFPIPMQNPKGLIVKYRVKGIGQVTNPDPDAPLGAMDWTDWGEVAGETEEVQESLGKFRDSDFPIEVPNDGSEQQFRFRALNWDGQWSPWTGWWPKYAPWDWSGVGMPIRVKKLVAEGTKDEQAGLLSGQSHVCVTAVSPSLSQMIWWNRSYNILTSAGDCPSVSMADYQVIGNVPNYVYVGAFANYRSCSGLYFEVSDNEQGTGATEYSFLASDLPRNLPLTGDHYFRMKGNWEGNGCTEQWTPFMKMENHAVFRHVAVGHNAGQVGVLHDKFTTGEGSGVGEVWLTTYTAGAGGGTSVLIHAVGASMPPQDTITIPVPSPIEADFYDIEWAFEPTPGNTTHITEGVLMNVPIEDFPKAIPVSGDQERHYRLCYKKSCKIVISLPDGFENNSFKVQLRYGMLLPDAPKMPANTHDVGDKYTSYDFPMKFDLKAIIKDDCRLYQVQVRITDGITTCPWFTPPYDNETRLCSAWQPAPLSSVEGAAVGTISSVAITGLGDDKFFLAYNYTKPDLSGAIAYAAVTDLSGGILGHTIWGYYGGQISVDSLDDNRVLVSIGSQVFIIEVEKETNFPIPIGIGMVSAQLATGASGHKGIAHLGEGVGLIAFQSGGAARVSSFIVQGNQIIPGVTQTVSSSGGYWPSVARLDGGSAIVTYQKDTGTFSPCSGEGGADTNVGGANLVFVGKAGELAIKEELTWDRPKSLPIYANMDFLQGTLYASSAGLEGLGAVVVYEPNVVVPDDPSFKWTGIKPVQELRVADLQLVSYTGGVFTIDGFFPSGSKTLEMDSVDFVGSDEAIYLPDTTGQQWGHEAIYWPVTPCSDKKYLGIHTQSSGSLQGTEAHILIYNIVPTVYPYNIITCNGRSFMDWNGIASPVDGWVQFAVSNDEGVTWSDIKNSAGCDDMIVMRLPATIYDSSQTPPSIMVKSALKGWSGIILFDVATAIERPPDIYPRANIISVSDPQATKCAEYSTPGGVMTPLADGRSIPINPGAKGMSLQSMGAGVPPKFVETTNRVEQLMDVEIIDLADKRVLSYSATSQTWLPREIPELPDAQNQGDILQWQVDLVDPTKSKFVTADMPDKLQGDLLMWQKDLVDDKLSTWRTVTKPDKVNGDLLTWYEDEEDPTLSEWQFITKTDKSTGDIIAWDGTLKKWVIGNISDILEASVGKTIKSAPVSITGVTSSTVVIPAVIDKKIALVGIGIMVSGAIKVTVKSSAGTEIMKNMDTSVKGNGIVYNIGGDAFFTTADVNQGISIDIAQSAYNTTAASYTVGGIISYYEL